MSSSITASKPKPGPADKRGLGHRLVANTLANFVGQGLIVVFGFVATPYIVNHMGPTMYGVLILLFAYVEAFALLDLGFNVSLVKFLAELIPQGRTDDANAYLGTALTLFMLGGVGIGIAVPLVAPTFLLRSLTGQEELYGVVVVGLWVASAAFVVRFIGQASAAVLVAVQRFDLSNMIGVGSETLRVLGAVGALYLGYGLVGVIAVSLIVNILAFAVNLIVARDIAPGLSFRPRFSLHHCRAILHFSKYMVVANVSARLMHSADKVVLSQLMSAAQVAFYSVPYNLGQKLWIGVGNVTGVVFPAASALKGADANAQLRELYLRGTKFVAALAGFPAVLLWSFPDQILGYWIGTDFALHGALALTLLNYGFFLNCLGHIPAVMSQAVGKPHISAGFAAATAVLNLVLLALLVPRFGIDGAAASFLVCQALLMPLLIHRANRLLGVSWLSLTRQSYLPTAVACALALGVCWLLRSSVTSLTSLATAAIVALAVYAAAVFVVVLDSRDRTACGSLLSDRLAFFGSQG